jgi:cytochrome c-type biogenesis protein CcmH
MVEFWISAAVMVAVALAFVLPPLIGRARAQDVSRDAVNLAIYRERRQELESQRDAGLLDESSFEGTLAELDRDLLQDVEAPARTEEAPDSRSPYPAVVAAVLLPLAAFSLYGLLGTPEAGGERAHSLEEMVSGLARRLADTPDDPEGWLMLGRSYAAMNRLEDAQAALEESDRRRPDHPMTLVALAEVVAGQQGNRLDGEPARLVARALEIDPSFARALWLAGVDAFNRDDRARAAELWQRILSTPDLSPEATARVQQALAQTGVTPQAAPAQTPTTAAGGPTVTVDVSLDPSLAARVEGGETVFVFARAASGPRMPLAIARLSAADLPAQVTLDESMAMAPQMSLATFEQVVVGARISRSGNATPSSGDLEGSSGPVVPAQQPQVTVTIDRVVP